MPPRKSLRNKAEKDSATSGRSQENVARNGAEVEIQDGDDESDHEDQGEEEQDHQDRVREARM